MLINLFIAVYTKIFKSALTLKFMTTLIASLGSGKGTWANLFKLMKVVEWEKIILVGSPFFTKSFNDKNPRDKNVLVLTVNPDKDDYDTIINKLSGVLSKEVEGVEVALNMLSGTGKEHMILLASVLKAGFGIRLVDFEDGRLKELSF